MHVKDPKKDSSYLKLFTGTGAQAVELWSPERMCDALHFFWW